MDKKYPSIGVDSLYISGQQWKLQTFHWKEAKAGREPKVRMHASYGQPGVECSLHALPNFDLGTKPPLRRCSTVAPEN